MSLDVYLELPEASAEGTGIFVREDGRTREITREEWDERLPGREPLVMAGDSGGCVYAGNITHNLNRMAKEAGIYKVMWRPEEIGITTAEQLIEPLREGVRLLKAYPGRFRAFDSPNGWGIYDHFVPFVEEYLAACERYPQAMVRVSR